MLNFTVGPVMSDKNVLEIGSQQVPYFRTPEFSEIMLENERLMKDFADAEENARVVFITGSGTASMEASVINSFTSKDKLLIVNGGSFGQRFVDICSLHEIPFTQIKVEMGKALTKEQLYQYDGKDYTGFLVNVHETSTGVHFDLDMIGQFCRRNNLYLVVDAVSSFLADELSMKDAGIDIMITGSQKALACPPGISIIVMSDRAVKRAMSIDVKSFYLNLKSALKNGERGQTPFTPAVGTLLQIHERLVDIEKSGGVEAERNKIAAIACDFRDRIKNLPFEVISDSPSNAVTPLHPLTASAKTIFSILKDEYGIWVCPNGGDMADAVFRVGHIGCLTVADNKKLCDAFEDLRKRGII